jgi:hypothetical protein
MWFYGDFMKKKLLVIILSAIIVYALSAFICGCSGINSLANTYVVTYYLDDDSSPIKVTANSEGTFPFKDDKIPTKSHCKFAGLYDAKTGGGLIVTAEGEYNVVITGSTTLYAHWTGNDCRLVYDAGEGTLDEASQYETITYGSTIATMPEPEYYGYDFVGWFSADYKTQYSEAGTPKESKSVLNDKNYSFTSNTDIVYLYAKYETAKYSLTLDYNDDYSYESETISITHGKTLESVTLPTVDTGKREIVGWSVSPNSMIEYTDTFDGDLTLYAIWKSYRLAYCYSGTTQIDTLKVYSDEPLELPTPERDGAEFEGWYFSESFSGNPIGSKLSYGYLSVDGTNIYARWNLLDYTITLIGEDGQIYQQLSYTVDDEVTFPEYTAKKYYTFVGWHDNADLSGPLFTELEKGTFGDCTFYARVKKQEEYKNYTYITTASEWSNIPDGTKGAYLLANDINMNGAKIKPIANFGGTLDGGGNTIYNFIISTAVEFSSPDTGLGLFANLLSGAKVYSLQVGKNAYTTTISYSYTASENGSAAYQYNVGYIAGYSEGTISDCRVINCSISVDVGAIGSLSGYDNWEFYSNVGGICGVVRSGSISGCYVTNSSFSSHVTTQYKGRSSWARVGGIAGFADSSTISDCYVKSTELSSVGEAYSGIVVINFTNAPHARTGGIVGELVMYQSAAAKLLRCVVYNNYLSTSIKWGEGNGYNGNSDEYKGSVIGKESSSSSSYIVGISTQDSCCGSNSSYGGYSTTTSDNYDAFIAANPTFNNGKWISENGKLALKFE